jgi:hypothetical protein
MLAEPTEPLKNVTKGRRLRGQALMAQGKLEPAEEELSAALEIARRAGNPPQLWRTLAVMGELRRGQGDAQGALDSYLEALTAINVVAEALTDTGLRAKFLSSQQVSAIQQAAEGRTGTAEAR